MAATVVFGQRVGIELVPDRSEVFPDGRSRVTVTARIQAGNAPVPDGSVVRFATTAGRLENDRVATSGGVARVVLVAGDQPGTARVTANLEGPFVAVPSETLITFSKDADRNVAAGRGKPWIRMTGTDFVGYAVNVAGSNGRFAGAFSRNGGSVLTAGDLLVGGDGVQLDLDRGIVRAVGNVILYRGKDSRSFDRLVWDLAKQTGFGEISGGAVVQISGRDLAIVPATGVAPNAFDIVDQGIAESTVECRVLEIEQGGLGRILMRDATLYVGGQRLLSVPFHTMLGTQRTLFREQLIGLGPSGVTLDLPFHFDVRPRSVGTLHLRRGAQFGSSIYASRSGWNLDLDQSFDTNGGRGLFQILNMSRPERGLRLQHGQQLGAATDMTVFLDSPNSRDLFGTLQVGHVVGGMRLSGFATANRTRLPGYAGGGARGDIQTQWMAETFSRPLRGARTVQVSWNLASQEVRSFGDSASNPPLRSQSISTRMMTRARDIGNGVRFTQSVMVGRTFSSRASLDGGTFQGTSSFARALGSAGNVQANYEYIASPNRLTLSSGANPRHRVSFGTDFATGNGVAINISGAEGLDVRQSSVSAGVGVPLGSSWEGRVRMSDTSLAGMAFRETEYALVRTVAGRTVGIFYSTVARRIQLDLTGGLRF